MVFGQGLLIGKSPRERLITGGPGSREACRQQNTKPAKMGREKWRQGYCQYLPLSSCRCSCPGPWWIFYIRAFPSLLTAHWLGFFRTPDPAPPSNTVHWKYHKQYTLSLSRALSMTFWRIVVLTFRLTFSQKVILIMKTFSHISLMLFCLISIGFLLDYVV